MTPNSDNYTFINYLNSTLLLSLLGGGSQQLTYPPAARQLRLSRLDVCVCVFAQGGGPRRDLQSEAELSERQHRRRGRGGR